MTNRDRAWWQAYAPFLLLMLALFAAADLVSHVTDPINRPAVIVLTLAGCAALLIGMARAVLIQPAPSE